MNHLEDNTSYVPDAGILLTDLSSSEIAVLTVGTIAGFITLAIYGWEVHRKFRSDLTPNHRNKLLVILALFPVYAASHTITLWCPNTVSNTELLCMLFFVISIVRFLELVENYFSGEEAMLDTVKDVEFSLAVRPFCCCVRCCPTITFTRSVFTKVYLCVLQYIVISTLIIYADSVMKTLIPLSTYQMYLSIVRLLSTLTAMFSLRVFLTPTEAHFPKHKLKQKFACIQLCLLATNLQRAIFQSLAKNNVFAYSWKWTPNALAEWYHSATLLIGICLITILATFAFNDKEKLFPIEVEYVYSNEATNGDAETTPAETNLYQDYGTQQS